MRAPRNPVIEPADLRLLSAPLDFLEAEHYRFRVFLAHLERMAVDHRVARRAAAARFLLEFLLGDIARHLAEEAEALFPQLRERCQAADGIDRILGLVEGERARARDLSLAVIAGLRECASRCAPEAGFAAIVATFIGAMRRHIDWENALVLPLARKRLTSGDLARLATDMATRRGAGGDSVGARQGYFGE